MEHLQQVRLLSCEVGTRRVALQRNFQIDPIA
jgi:hypothetical protein